MIEVRPGGRRRIDRVLSPDYTSGIEQHALGDVRALRDEAAQEETDLSYLRRVLHARIDIVRAEQRRRREDGSRSVVEQLDRALNAYTSEEDSVSQRRREVQQVVDRLNAEIARRYREGAASVDDLLAEERDRR